MGNEINIQKEFACMVAGSFDRRKEVTAYDIVRFLFDQGWIDYRLPQKAVIKQFYFQQLRANGGCVEDAILDCMAVYDVSYSFVVRIIYNRKLKI